MTIKNFKNRDHANINNLIKITNLIKNLDYFLFFGTLLGDIRENTVIKDDDDIDFLINLKEINLLENILKTNGFIVSVKEEYFISFYNKNIVEPHTIDFYVYYLANESVVIPKSFYGNCFFKLKRHFLILDKNLFFPTLLNSNGAKIPNKSMNIVSILYGKKWNEKLIKNLDYFIYFRKNTPRVTYRSKLIKFLYLIRLISELRIVAARRFLLQSIGFYKLFNRISSE